MNRAYATSIPSNTDLNGYINCGNYYSADASVSATLQHSPYDTQGFLLYVIHFGNVRKHIAIPTIAREIKIRTYNNNQWDEEWTTIS